MHAMENDPYQFPRNPSAFTSKQNAICESTLEISDASVLEKSI